MAPLEVQYACESFLPVILALGAAAAAISAQQPARMALPTPASLNRLPAGATVERSGFLTIEQAPPSPVPPLRTWSRTAPASVNFTALPSRLVSTCTRRCSS